MDSAWPARVKCMHFLHLFIYFPVSFPGQPGRAPERSFIYLFSVYFCDSPGHGHAHTFIYLFIFLKYCGPLLRSSMYPPFHLFIFPSVHSFGGMPCVISFVHLFIYFSKHVRMLCAHGRARSFIYLFIFPFFCGTSTPSVLSQPFIYLFFYFSIQSGSRAPIQRPFIYLFIYFILFIRLSTR